MSNGSDLEKRLEGMGIAVPRILVPGSGMAAEKWAVIACDQFSSERTYWEETRRIVGSSPSTLDLIIPECYLEDGDRDDRVEAANSFMTEYLERSILKKLSKGLVLVDRSTAHVPSRKGLVIAVDLETYDFSEGSKSLIRPTEGTIRDRLPPRMAVRRGAKLDLPHILILIDDPEDSVMNAADAAASETVYDFDLIQGGGHIKGRHVPLESMEGVTKAFETLAAQSDLLFAVGDGNHSLATAKEIWKERRAEGAGDDDPARYALVEVENIHDAGLPFHPIHRMLFGVDFESMTADLKTSLEAKVSAAEEGESPASDEVIVVGPKGSEKWTIPVPAGRLVVEPLQDALDALLAESPDVDIDYIHGEDSVRDLTSAADDRLGIILPDLEKHSFFKRITDIGPYPRKSFSIGEAVEKRYYLEAREL